MENHQLLLIPAAYFTKLRWLATPEEISKAVWFGYPTLTHTEYAFDCSSKAHPVPRASLIRAGWLAMGDRTMGTTKEGVIPLIFYSSGWVRKEQLPDGWWDCKPRTVGLWRARKTAADQVARLSKQIEEEAGIRKPTIHDAIPMD